MDLKESYNSHKVDDTKGYYEPYRSLHAFFKPLITCPMKVGFGLIVCEGIMIVTRIQEVSSQGG